MTNNMTIIYEKEDWRSKLFYTKQNNLVRMDVIEETFIEARNWRGVCDGHIENFF